MFLVLPGAVAHIRGTVFVACKGHYEPLHQWHGIWNAGMELTQAEESAIC